MKLQFIDRSFVPALASLLAAALFVPSQVHAHCEVPCGIYGDQLRFEAMLEDQKTIAKAIDKIGEQATQLSEATTPLSVNQAARWVATKEDHANRIQHTIAQYFLTQQIKPAAGDAEKVYLEKLTTAHAVMRAAMKAKQDPTAAVAAALRTAILDFYRAYEGKEPNFQ